MNTSLCTVSASYINTDEPHYALSVFLNILSCTCTSLCIESVSYNWVHISHYVLCNIHTLHTSLCSQCSLYKYIYLIMHYLCPLYNTHTSLCTVRDSHLKITLPCTWTASVFYTLKWTCTSLSTVWNYYI